MSDETIVLDYDGCDCEGACMQKAMEKAAARGAMAKHGSATAQSAVAEISALSGRSDEATS